MLAVVACGAVAGLGGAVLSLQQVGTFSDGMTGGRGYLALASLIVARWNPLAAALACLAFGAAEAFELGRRAPALPLSSYVVQMAPYLIALAVLAGLGRSSKMPAAIGQPLQWDSQRGDRSLGSEPRPALHPTWIARALPSPSGRRWPRGSAAG